ncbi:MAG: DUF63 family protein [Methanobacteriaceae archaeon]|jgi:uncharacterized membrane protein|nr:DUF63 family protein [Candidatus Methanorudis spinitermitis]
MTIEIAILDFLQRYFFSGYTIFNTLVYGIILVVMIFFIIKMFKYYDLNPIDLIFPLIPFIFLGSGIRALVDNGIYPYNWFLITPGIYFIVGGLAILAIFMGLLIQKKTNFDYKYTIFIIGLILAIVNYFMIPSVNLVVIFQVILIWVISTLIFILSSKFWSLYRDKINLYVLSAHLFDASSTFVAVDFYGYWEQHVIPNSIYNLTGTAITMFPLKIIVISFVLYLIDKYMGDNIVSKTLKLAIFILGLSPAIRNFLSLTIGVS